MPLTPEALARLASKAQRRPSDAQKEAGNYRKGHVAWNGLDISIENAKGHVREGKDKSWKVTMPAHYGYVKGTEGSDGDHVDVYLGDHPDSPHVFVVDQIDHKTKKFDEHKALLGFRSKEEAVTTYHRGFSDDKGPDRVGAVTPLSVDAFKGWVKTRATKKPMAYREKEMSMFDYQDEAGTPGPRPGQQKPSMMAASNGALGGRPSIIPQAPAGLPIPPHVAHLEMLRRAAGGFSPQGLSAFDFDSPYRRRNP